MHQKTQKVCLSTMQQTINRGSKQTPLSGQQQVEMNREKQLMYMVAIDVSLEPQIF